jgi:exodeoxyribonuclease VII small subunit
MRAVTRPKPKPPEEPKEAKTFETTLQRLAEIVEQLEEGELPLERSVKLFEEGIQLSRASQTILDDAERRVEELLGFDDRGKPIVRNLPVDDLDEENVD